MQIDRRAIEWGSRGAVWERSLKARALDSFHRHDIIGTYRHSYRLTLTTETNKINASLLRLTRNASEMF